MIAITQRCIKILKYLCNATAPLTARWLCEHMNVSERTVRYDIALLTDWMLEQGVIINAIPKKGISLSDESRKKATQILAEFGETHCVVNRFLNADERISMIVANILEGKISWSLDDAPELFGVSRSTFLRDIEKVEEWFFERGVHLLRRQKKGVRFDVDETELRRLIVDYICEHTDQRALLSCLIQCSQEDINSIKPSSNSFVNRIFESVDLPKIIDALNKDVKKRGVSLTDVGLISFICYFSVMLLRIRNGCVLTCLPNHTVYFETIVEELCVCKAFEESVGDLIDKTHMTYESAYLAACYSLTIENGSHISNAYTGELARKISKIFLHEVEHFLGYDLSLDKEILEELIRHLQAAIMRVQFNMPAHNGILEDAKRKFSEIFFVCEVVAKNVEQSYGIKFNEDEIGFITIHIVSAIQSSKFHPIMEKNFRTVIICSQGIATAKFLMNSLRIQFPRIVVTQMLSVFDVYTFNFSNIDIVFTTVDIPIALPRPCLKVSPLLTKLDVRRIDSFLRTQQHTISNVTKEIQVNELLNVVGKYCNIRDEDGLLRELRIIIGKHTDLWKMSSQLPSLLDILQKKNIRAHIDADSWEDAVIKTAEPLLSNGCVTQEYVQEIIDIKNKHGQYALISEGVCMPHASPNSANRLAMSMTTLRKPIEVVQGGQAVRIYVVIVLSLTDTVTQARALDEMFNLLDEFPNLGEKLHCAESTADLSRQFKMFYDSLYQ